MMDANFYKNELYQMQKNYKNNRLRDIKLPHPEWLKSDDPMSSIYEEKSILLQKGTIIYASLVQANTLLFKRFPPYNCPAQIIYSTNSFFDPDTVKLYTIASYLYSYKNQPESDIPDGLKEIAKVITDERDRTDFTFSWNINGKLTEFRMLPTMIYRKLLPKGKLCGNLFPILTAPECNQILILPKQYWTKNFTQAWVDGKI